MFELDERLEKDTVPVGNFPLSLLLMSRDANYPWCILVPRREGITELYQLGEDDMASLAAESRHLSRVMMAVFGGDKLNVAALGNVVPQLHIHHVVRFRDDISWPGPVWGAAPARDFVGQELQRRVNLMASRLAEGFEPARPPEGGQLT